MSELAQALLNVQTQLPVMPHDSHGHGFTYLSLDRMLETLRPILAANGLVLMQLPAAPSFAGNIALETRLMHVSGESISQVGELPMMDENKRMNASQAGGAAYTYLRRYGVAAMFGIVSDADIDARPQELPSGVSEEEMGAITGTSAAEFPSIVAALDDNYNHAKHVIASMKKLNYESIPGSAEERVKAYSELKARKNGAVMS